MKKVVVVGLDAVGKTSIIKRVFENEELGYLQDLAPTRGIARDEYQIGDNTIGVLDLGGQRLYREDYLLKPQIFRQVDLLIYVIDILDDARLEESLEYLKKILLINRELNATLDCVILLHKSDPHLFSEISGKTFSLTKRIKSLKNVFPFDIKVYTTSIYVETLEYAFDKILKEHDIELSVQQEHIIRPKTFVGKSERERKKVPTSPGTDDNGDLDPLVNYLSIRGLPLIEDFESLHSTVVDLFEQKTQHSSQDAIVKYLIEPVKLALLQFLIYRVNRAKEVGALTPPQVRAFSAVLGQLNLLKVQLYHFLNNNTLTHMKNTITFGEKFDLLIEEIIIAAHLMDLITNQEYLDIQKFRDGEEFDLVENKRPSMETHHRKDVSQSEGHLQYLQEQRTKVKQAKERYLAILQQKGDDSPLEDNSKKRLQQFIDLFDLLQVQFWFLTKELPETEFELNRKIKTQFVSITDQLLHIARIMQLLSGEERNELNLLVKQL